MGRYSTAPQNPTLVQVLQPPPIPPGPQPKPRVTQCAVKLGAELHDGSFPNPSDNVFTMEIRCEHFQPGQAARMRQWRAGLLRFPSPRSGVALQSCEISCLLQAPLAKSGATALRRRWLLETRVCRPTGCLAPASWERSSRSRLSKLPSVRMVLKAKPCTHGSLLLEVIGKRCFS